MRADHARTGGTDNGDDDPPFFPPQPNAGVRTEHERMLEALLTLASSERAEQRPSDDHGCP
jgi:hypothetical protein